MAAENIHHHFKKALSKSLYAFVVFGIVLVCGVLGMFILGVHGLQNNPAPIRYAFGLWGGMTFGTVAILTGLILISSSATLKTCGKS